MTTGMLIVLAIVAVAVVLFVLEPVPIDVTALLVLVLLVLLEPWTQIGPLEAVSGFSNPATITVLAMLILSEGVRRTGVVESLGRRLSKVVNTSERRHLAATIGMSGPISGLMNNTPVVALLMPVVNDMAHKAKISPSKLLLPLSYASMLGGMLTLIGTSTNILASDLSARLLDQRMGMFEFTHLGLIVLVVGAVYLIFAAPKLLPERIKPQEDYLEEYAVGPYLTEVYVGEDAPMIGLRVGKWLEIQKLRVDVLALIRGDEKYDHPYRDNTLQPGDMLLVHASRRRLDELMAVEGIDSLTSPELTPDEIITAGDFNSVVELVIPSGSRLEGQSVAESKIAERFDAFILAIRRGGETIRERLSRQTLAGGDTLLVQTTPEGVETMQRSQDVVVLVKQEREAFRREKRPWMYAIILGVIGFAAADLVPIVVSALAGVVAMVLTGVLRPSEMYAAVDWRVIFLLAGIIPLGIALEQTGTASYLGQLLASSAYVLPTIVVLWLFYIATGLITEVISNNASVLLMIPVAAETAGYIDANPFAFVLAVMFAASTAFLGPVGYQTNLFVYGPGGYRVSDFVRLGAPLQLVLSVVTVGGIALFWGV
jgi:di/tricarboxylate transporter